MSSPTSILYFDGVCNLCNRTVDYIIKHDKAQTFHFASLQSNFAAETLKPYNLDPKDLDSVILILNGQCYIKSRAAAQVLIQLGGWRAIIGRLIALVPKSFADWGYLWIARNRYRWFGQSETCRIPTPSERERFIDI